MKTCDLAAKRARTSLVRVRKKEIKIKNIGSNNSTKKRFQNASPLESKLEKQPLTERKKKRNTTPEQNSDHNRRKIKTKS